MWKSLMNNIGRVAVENMQKELKKNGFQNSRIINDMTYEVDFDEDFDEWELNFKLPNYSIYIEEGRKPNSKLPPEKPILAWMKRKNIPEKASFPIRKKIAEDGILPKPFMGVIAQTISATSQAMLEATDALVYKRLKEVYKKLTI